MQDLVTELDLALVNALQVRPRASWTELGKVLDVDPVTVARRWKRLTDAGLAWVTCYTASARRARMAYVEVDCRSEAVGDVAQELARDPHVVSVHHLTGARSLLLSLAVHTPAALSVYLMDRLGKMKGITATRTQVVTAIYGDASLWRLRSLEPAQRQALQTTGPQASRPAALTTEVSAEDRRLIQTLAADGRQSCAVLAERTGLSEPTVRRRLNRLLNQHEAVLRCEVAQKISGWPYTAVLWASAPTGQLEHVGRSLASVPEIRACAAVSGTSNLLLFAWLRDVTDLHRLEQLVVQRHPDVTITERAVSLHTIKLLGRLLDADGHSIGHVPVDFWLEQVPLMPGRVSPRTTAHDRTGTADPSC
ncbi:Lrp/AsnC family transcriptional regulator [Streptomyces antnestii]|uniref:Lrp/AsnC family transcriptional regulator n=1 Tax=Streptomyces antnestii TaxID=2494256 RepID=A0A3S2YM33_9ACTN|nr:Lrp/AsnC family transcriptional regulator [Streptomyces sp. San01]RVU14610.1 Lrp/AsnC family transcriptional regulator [Streptomyces sp. San01]